MKIVVNLLGDICCIVTVLCMIQLCQTGLLAHPFMTDVETSSNCPHTHKKRLNGILALLCYLFKVRML